MVSKLELLMEDVKVGVMAGKMVALLEYYWD
jgi:hypothetical protein